MLNGSSEFGHPCLVDLTGCPAATTPLVRATRQGENTPYKEDLLQVIIDSNPAVLPVRDFLPTTSSVVSLGREIELSIGERTGYVDNLLITNEGWLVVVETKLWRNPQSTREVIAQILEYGMALGGIGIRSLEGLLKLPGGTSLREFLQDTPAGEHLIDDFEDVVERRLRRGEMLYLIASDAIRFSVERIADWLNKGGSAPFKFGLVELRFFDMPQGGVLVVPRTLLQTREISRHVVVVDVQGPGADHATVVVQDKSGDAAGHQPRTQRTVKTASTPMTAERLIAGVKDRFGQASSDTVERILQTLDATELETRPTATGLHYGVVCPPESAVFYPLLAVTVNGAWSHPPYAAIAILGADNYVQHKLRLNDVGLFYRPEEASDPSKRRHDLTVAYKSLAGAEERLAHAITLTANTLIQRVSS